LVVRPFTGSFNLLKSGSGQAAEGEFRVLAPNYPEAAIEPSARPKKLRLFVLTVDTRKGKTVISCASEKGRKFEARLREVAALVRSVRAPR